MTMARISKHSVFDAPFEGIEWDLEYKVNRTGLKWVDALGAPPRGLHFLSGASVANGEWDTVDATFTVWTGADNAALLEQIPPYANGYTFDLYLPGLENAQALPGFGQWEPSGRWLFSNLTPTTPVEPVGRKAPIVDLWGYRFAVHFSAAGGGTALNELNGVGLSGSGRGAMPDFFGTKFIAHQIQDWSRSATPVPYGTAGQGTAVYTGVHHGRRRDGGIAFDHLNSLQAQQVIDWFRLIRATPFSYTTDQPFGPGQPDTVNAVARELTVNRGAGWWWDLKLEVSLYL